jgi:hypothetical protein
MRLGGHELYILILSRPIHGQAIVTHEGLWGVRELVRHGGDGWEWLEWREGGIVALGIGIIVPMPSSSSPSSIPCGRVVRRGRDPPIGVNHLMMCVVCVMVWVVV